MFIIEDDTKDWLLYVYICQKLTQRVTEPVLSANMCINCLYKKVVHYHNHVGKIVYANMFARVSGARIIVRSVNCPCLRCCKILVISSNASLIKPFFHIQEKERAMVKLPDTPTSRNSRNIDCTTSTCFISSFHAYSEE